MTKGRTSKTRKGGSSESHGPMDSNDLKKRYDDLLNRNLAGIFRTTLKGRFIECNDAMAQVLGYADKDELMAAPASALYFTPKDRERYLADLMVQGRLVNYGIRLKHKTGRPVEVLENVYLDQETGEETTVLGMLMDITAVKQAEAEQRALMASYRTLVERTQDGLLVVADGIIRYANPAAMSLLGEGLLGTSFVDRFVEEDREPIIDAIHRAQAGEMPEVLAHPPGPDGREIALLCVATLHDGQAGVQVTMQDRSSQRRIILERVQLQIAKEVNKVLRDEIEQHRRTQEELRRSRRFARNLIDSSLDMIMAADEEGRITEYNPAASIRFGYEPEEVLGKSTIMLYADPAEYHRVQQELDRHGAFSGEVSNVDRYGVPFISYLAASRLFDEDGQVIGAMGVSRDITHMKRDQEALRVSEERYRDLFENATDLIQSVRPDGRFEYVNAAWRKTLGYSDEDLLQRTIWDIVDPVHHAAFRAYLEGILSGDAAGVIRTVFRAKDGRPVTVEGSSTVRRTDGMPMATRSIFRDITGALEASQRIQEHEAKWRALFESSEHLFWTVDREIKLTSHNKAYGDAIERLYGHRPEINQDPDRPRKLFAPRGYHDFWEGKYAEAFSGMAIRFNTDIVDRQGNRVCNEVFLSPVFAADGTVKEVFGVGHEITEQKLAEEKVRDQAARLQAIFDSSANMMIWTLDKDFRITSCNHRFRHAVRSDFGIELDAGDLFLGAASEAAAGSNHERYTDHYLAAFKGRPQQFEAELVDREGRTIWVENFINPIIVDGEVQELSCQAHHITERKEAQRELLRSLAEKESLLKEVHHRVKNNLQVISSITKLQSEHAGLDPKVQEMLHHSRDRIRSMALIHESLYQNKQFSRIDLAEYVDGLARNLMLSYSLTGRIDLEMSLKPVYLNIDQAMPCGLILNEVISNALKHGYPDGRMGTVRIAIGVEGDRVSIRISDDGVGLSPGFAEERDGRLGLELIRMLVDQLDGRLERTSVQGVSYLLTFERLKNYANGADERSRGGG